MGHKGVIHMTHRWAHFIAVGLSLLAISPPLTAQPALTCSAQAAATPVVRAEGLTELVGDVVLRCIGGTPTPVGRQVPGMNIQVFMNTNITSRNFTGPADPLTEALLFIDDPMAANQPEFRS
jgi:hypothetical protein